MPTTNPPVSQVLIEMALAAGQGMGPTVSFDLEAAAFWNKHYKNTVRLALSTPKSDWSKDRKNALKVALAMGQEAKRLAGSGKKIDREMAKAASRSASVNPICPVGGGRYCP